MSPPYNADIGIKPIQPNIPDPGAGPAMQGPPLAQGFNGNVAGGIGQWLGEDSPPGTIAFDRIDRISYVAPPTSGQVFPIFQFPRDYTQGFITRIGINSPQIDFFGQNEYLFQLDQQPPYEQALAASGNTLSANSFFGFIPLGTLDNPKRVRIIFRANNVWQIKIRPQATPAANVVVYNLFIRTVGYGIK
jgi:hypothetical protein